MKSLKFFLLPVLLMITFPLIAQFGLQGGPAFSSIKSEDEGFEEKYSPTTGFIVGAFYRKPLGKSFAFQPEVNWMQKAGKDEVDFEEYAADMKVVINYLEIPLYFLYNGGKSSGLYGGIGPSFNFGMSGKFKVEADGEEMEEDIKFGNDEDMKGFNLSINAQLGYQFQKGLLFNAFLSQTITNSASDNWDDGKLSMFSYGIRVGYLFNNTVTDKNQLKVVF